MEKFNIEKMAMIIDMYKYCDEEIKKFKEYCRMAPQKEIDKINQGNKLIIKRSDKPITTRGEEYDKKVEELKALYPTITTYEINGKIELQSTSYTKGKREIITDNILQLNKAQLVKASKNANIK